LQRKLLSEHHALEELEKHLEEEVKQRLYLEQELLDESNKLNQQQVMRTIHSAHGELFISQ
jgi:hypothetical protein